MLRLAFDIGGTFTDYVLQDTGTGRTRIWKVPTTADPAQGVEATLRDKIAAGELSFADVSAVIHATTIATNAILERKGARTAFVTTAGFRDVLLIGRQKRYDMNDLHLEKPRPLVDRADIFTVEERIAADGRVVKPLDEEGARALARTLKQAGYRSRRGDVPAFLRQPAHERRMAEILRSEASPPTSRCRATFRRNSASTSGRAPRSPMPTCGPWWRRYLDALDGSMRQKGLAAPLDDHAIERRPRRPRISPAPIRCASSSSGPAAGVLMCAAVGRQLGCEHVMSFDMGGTTAKLGTIDHGEPIVTASYEVDTINAKRNSGLPLNILAIELLEIGAGGGSLADTRMGLITVGPQSAGAVPGPICYRAGGTRPTITDANLVLGYLNAGLFQRRRDDARPRGRRRRDRGGHRQAARPVGRRSRMGNPLRSRTATWNAPCG